MMYVRLRSRVQHTRLAGTVCLRSDSLDMLLYERLQIHCAQVQVSCALFTPKVRLCSSPGCLSASAASQSSGSASVKSSSEMLSGIACREDSGG